MNSLKKLASIAGLASLALVSTACAAVSTEPDEVAIAYNAALGSATKFSKCIGTSKRESVNMSDNTWTYPAGARTFDFSGGESSESGPLSVVSKDNVELQVPGIANFALNTDCATLRLFHERIGLKLKAYLYGTEAGESASGWRQMLDKYFKTQLDRALDAASQEFEWRKLYNDPATKQKWEARAGQLAGQFITEVAGGQFFCQPNYTGAGECGAIQVTLQKPQPPQNLVDALAADQAARAQNEAQKQINTKARTELESIKDLVKVLGPDAYVKLRAIQDGRAQIIITDGNGVNVTPKQAP